jgi:Glycosyl hydrolase family 26
MNTKTRRALIKLALPLLVVGAAGLASTAQASAATVPIGLYAGPGAVSSLTSFASWLGVPVNYATDYVPYTNGWSTDFNPQWLVGPWGSWVKASPNRRLVLGVPLLENGYAGQFSQEAAGAFDTYFSGLGTQLVLHGLGSTIIRLGYEANNPDIGPWQATDDPSGYIAAYRHIVGVLRAVPGQHFLFDWNPTAGLTPNLPLNSFASFYPGDDVVDIIGLDCYDIDWNTPTATPQQRWSDLVNETMGLQDQRTFADAHDKPVSFPEWGLYAAQSTLFAGGGDDPYYVNQMASWINSSNTAYESYFDLNWGGGTLASYPLSEAAYVLDFGPVSLLGGLAPEAPPTAGTSGSGSSTSTGSTTTTTSTPPTPSTPPTTTPPPAGKSGGSKAPKHRVAFGELSAGVLTAAISDALHASKRSRHECAAASKHSARASSRRRCDTVTTFKAA